VAALLCAAAACADNVEPPKSGLYADVCAVATLPLDSDAELAVVHDRLDPLIRSIPEGVPISRREANIMMAAHKLSSVSQISKASFGSQASHMRDFTAESFGTPEKNRAELAAACGVEVP
jgi:hypothetical protein